MIYPLVKDMTCCFAVGMDEWSCWWSLVGDGIRGSLTDETVPANALWANELQLLVDYQGRFLVVNNE